jgi:cytochrome c553
MRRFVSMHMEEFAVRKRLPFIGSMMVMLSAGAHAADPNLGRNLAATCANCHGTDGRSAGGIPAIAGVAKGTLLAQMKAFQTGERPATIMHQISKGYTDAQLDAITTYLSSRQPAGGAQ